jgi:Helicase associated domain
MRNKTTTVYFQHGGKILGLLFSDNKTLVNAVLVLKDKKRDTGKRRRTEKEEKNRMITTQDHINFEKDIVQYFQWRVTTLANNGGSNNNKNNEIAKLNKTKINDDTKEDSVTELVLQQQKDCTVVSVDTKIEVDGANNSNTNNHEIPIDKMNVDKTQQECTVDVPATKTDDSTTDGHATYIFPSPVLTSASLIVKYRKIFSLLQTELDFINTSNNHDDKSQAASDTTLEPDVFLSWKEYCRSKQITMAAGNTTPIGGKADIQKNVSVICNDVNKNIDGTPPLRKRKRTNDQEAKQLTSVERKTTPRKGAKSQNKDVNVTAPQDTLGNVFPPLSQRIFKHARISNKRLNTAPSTIADIPVEVKQQVLKQEKKAIAAERKAEKLEFKLLKSSAREEKLGDQLSKLKDKLKKTEQNAQDIKESKKRKREEKKKKEEHGKKSYGKWDDRYQQLCEFYEKFGHCKVTRPKKDENDIEMITQRALGEWVSDQRKYYRKKASILTQERIDKMNNIRFIWNPETYQKTFQMRVEDCKKFKEEHGHLNIPLINELNEDGTSPNEEEKRFRLWAQSIRHQYKRRKLENINNKLDKLKIKALEDIGFDWGNTTEGKAELGTVVHNDRFKDRIEQLRVVREQCNTCNNRKSILSVYPDDVSLYLWVKTQRKKYNKLQRGESVPSLSAERLLMLRGVDFDFNPRHETVSNRSASTSSVAALPAQADNFGEDNVTTPRRGVAFDINYNQYHN